MACTQCARSSVLQVNKKDACRKHAGRKARERSHTWPLACQQAAAWAPMLGDPLPLCAAAAHAIAAVQRGGWPMRCMVGTPSPVASVCPGSRAGCWPYLRSSQLNESESAMTGFPLLKVQSLGTAPNVPN